MPRPPTLIPIAIACTALACRPAVSAFPAQFPALQPGAVSSTAPLTTRQRHWVDSTFASLDLHDKVGQMIMIWMLGDYTNARDSSYAQATGWVEQDHVGGIAMSLGTPVEVAAKLNDIQRHARVPLIVGADLEPGLGRLEGGIFANYMLDAGSATVFPPQMAIGATGREQDAYDVAKAIAQEGRAVGIHVNFAPVVDVNNNPANPVINVRSFGEDPARVARLAANAVRGTLEGGELPTTKHFPGHGNTDVDSHVGLPIVNGNMAELDTVELVPFRAAIAAGAALVMTAHIALPAVEGDSTTPATLAPKIITGLLRDTLHFRGTAITDAMTMAGVGKGYTTEESSVLAVQAGADILLKPDDPTRAVNAVVAAVRDGRISQTRIDQAVRHILELKARSGVAFAPRVSLTTLREIVGAPEHRALAQDVARRAITLLRDSDNAIPLADTSHALVVEYAPTTELKAGRTFNAVLGRRAARRMTTVARIAPNSNRQALDSVARLADDASTVIITAYVRRVEGQGRFAIPRPIAAWIDTLAQHHRTIVVAFGNPYLLGQFPSVRAYMDAYGVSDALEQGAADAILGRQAITGRVPVSLPGFFRMGDGLQRAATSASRPTERPAPVRVMTYNIRSGNGDLAQTAETIREQAPDIVGLQEVDVHWADRSHFADQAAELASRLGMHARFARIYRLPGAPDAPPREFGVALLTRFPVLDFQDDTITRLSTQEANPVPTPMPGLLDAELDVHGSRVRVFVTHLDYRHEPSVRARQVTDMLRYLDSSSEPSILLGDLNADPDAPELQPLLRRMHDVWLVSGGPGFTYPADVPRERIDYVLVSPAFRVRDIHVIDTQASDHRPVVADLALP